MNGVNLIPTARRLSQLRRRRLDVCGRMCVLSALLALSIWAAVLVHAPLVARFDW